jgi:hypothetical protein
VGIRVKYDLKTVIKKNALSKINSQSHVDSKNIFGLKIVQVQVKLKANVILILSIFLDQKSSKYFPRKTFSNLTRHLQFSCLQPVFQSILTLCVIYDMKTAI